MPDILVVFERAPEPQSGYAPFAVVFPGRRSRDPARMRARESAAGQPRLSRNLSRLTEFAKKHGWSEAFEYAVEGPLSGTSLLFSRVPVDESVTLAVAFEHFVVNQRVDPPSKT